MTERLARQGFLGLDSSRVLGNATVGLVGLGGGGSHIVQQLAHLGIGGYVLVDPDIIEETNTNRLIGGTLEDVARQAPKVAIASRLIHGLVSNARVTAIQDAWLHATDTLMVLASLLLTQRELQDGALVPPPGFEPVKSSRYEVEVRAGARGPVRRFC